MNNITWDQYTYIKKAEDDFILLQIYEIDMADGDLNAGALLSRIGYWSRRDDKGALKVRVRKDGFLWIVKDHKDWFEEIRLPRGKLRTAAERLVTLGLIETKVFKFAGNPTTHYRIIQEEFMRQHNLILKNRYLERTDRQNEKERKRKEKMITLGQETLVRSNPNKPIPAGLPRSNQTNIGGFVQIQPKECPDLTKGMPRSNQTSTGTTTKTTTEILKKERKKEKTLSPSLEGQKNDFIAKDNVLVWGTIHAYNFLVTKISDYLPDYTRPEHRLFFNKPIGADDQDRIGEVIGNIDALDKNSEAVFQGKRLNWNHIESVLSKKAIDWLYLEEFEFWDKFNLKTILKPKNFKNYLHKQDFDKLMGWRFKDKAQAYKALEKMMVDMRVHVYKELGSDAELFLSEFPNEKKAFYQALEEKDPEFKRPRKKINLFCETPEQFRPMLLVRKDSIEDIEELRQANPKLAHLVPVIIQEELDKERQAREQSRRQVEGLKALRNDDYRFFSLWEGMDTMGRASALTSGFCWPNRERPSCSWSKYQVLELAKSFERLPSQIKKKELRKEDKKELAEKESTRMITKSFVKKMGVHGEGVEVETKLSFEYPDFLDALKENEGAVKALGLAIAA